MSLFPETIYPSDAGAFLDLQAVFDPPDFLECIQNDQVVWTVRHGDEACESGNCPPGNFTATQVGSDTGENVQWRQDSSAHFISSRPDDVVIEVGVSGVPGVPKQEIKLSSVHVELLADVNNDGIFNFDDNIGEDDPGKMVQLNHDDDNGLNGEDRTETGRVLGEDELVKVELLVIPTLNVKIGDKFSVNIVDNNNDGANITAW